MKAFEYLDYDEDMTEVSGVSFYHFPIVDGSLPTSFILQEFEKKVKEILKKDMNILIHCWKGEGRSVTMALKAAYGNGVENFDKVFSDSLDSRFHGRKDWIMGKSSEIYDEKIVEDMVDSLSKLVHDIKEGHNDFVVTEFDDESGNKTAIESPDEKKVLNFCDAMITKITGTPTKFVEIKESIDHQKKKRKLEMEAKQKEEEELARKKAKLEKEEKEKQFLKDQIEEYNKLKEVELKKASLDDINSISSICGTFGKGLGKCMFPDEHGSSKDSNIEWIFKDDKFIGVHLPADFVAEHERTCKGIWKRFGLATSTSPEENKSFNIEERRIKKLPSDYKYQNHAIYSSYTKYSAGLHCRWGCSDFVISPVTWHGRYGGMAEELMDKLNDAFQKLDIIMLRTNGSFFRAGKLTILIASEFKPFLEEE